MPTIQPSSAMMTSRWSVTDSTNCRRVPPIAGCRHPTDPSSNLLLLQAEGKQGACNTSKKRVNGPVPVSSNCSSICALGFCVFETSLGGLPPVLGWYVVPIEIETETDLVLGGLADSAPAVLSLCNPFLWRRSKHGSAQIRIRFRVSCIRFHLSRSSVVSGFLLLFYSLFGHGARARPSGHVDNSSKSSFA